MRRIRLDVLLPVGSRRAAWSLQARHKRTRPQRTASPRPKKAQLGAWASFSELSPEQSVLLRDKTVATLPKLNARSLGLLARTAAKAGASCDEPTWQELWHGVEAAARSLEHKPNDAANLVWALATVRYAASEELLDRLATTLIRHTSDLTPSAVATASWGYAMLAHPAPLLQQAMGAAMRARLDAFEPHEMCSILWAFAAADTPNAAVLSSLGLRNYIERVDWQSPADLCRLHQWRLWCEERELQGVARLSPALAARCEEAFHTTDVSPSAMQGAVAEALESLGMSPLHEVSEIEVRLKWQRDLSGE